MMSGAVIALTPTPAASYVVIASTVRPNAVAHSSEPAVLAPSVYAVGSARACARGMV